VTALLLLAQRLRCLRELHGLTQEQFAEKAGLSYKFYQQIESGRKKQLWLETLDRVAAGFGLDAWELLAPHPPTSLTARRSQGEALNRYPPPTSLLSTWTLLEENTTGYLTPRRKTGRPSRRKTA